MMWVLLLLLLTSQAFADYSVTAKERCYHETHLVQNNKGEYSVVVDKYETCVSSPNDWKDD